ncbi:hypothetical protein GDO78_021608 [Eleutherodactylus coqui]|uniref:Uncharacterized protein n=1 Tax=Eleutherodactylus coqui TaxID=57060 RepID=A0A8J6B3L2_ELECQ|nr:hypothetical protein GDO78_021608 [Eleutherodactylus coqui]
MARITSSAYNPILCSCEATLIPWIFWLALTVSANGSMIRANIRGDKGHPCLVPLEIANGEERHPEERTLADGAEYRDKMADLMGPEKPNLPRVASRNPQCMRSNAFSASSAKSRAGVLFLSATMTRFRNRRVPSGACLWGTNPTWSVATRRGRIERSLMLRSFAYILTSVFRREMGRKLAGDVLSFPGLGMVTIRASNISGGKEPLLIAPLNTDARWGG